MNTMEDLLGAMWLISPLGLAMIACVAIGFAVTALVLGFAISLFQSVTQNQEDTLSYVPKAAAVCAALLFSGNWMLHEMVNYTTQLFSRIPELIAA